MQIDGVPEGWELVRVGTPVFREYYIDPTNGSPIMAHFDFENAHVLIIRKIEKPKTYRPFANAEEFKPFRDRWQTRKDESDDCQQPGACRPSAYDNRGMWFGRQYTTYEEAFDSGRLFDDDGSPFGIEVTE